MKLLRGAAVTLLGLAALIMLYYAWRLLWGGMNTIRPVLLCILFVLLPFVSGTALLVFSIPDEAGRRRTVRTMLWTLFSFYLLALFGTLFFARIDLADYAAQRALYVSSLDLMTNLVPFETIRLYVRCLIYDFIGTTIPISNLMGNVLLFMPMAVFLPCLFPSMRSFWRFLVLMVAVLTAVEALQLVLCCGSCDVDDVILNLTGTLLVYGVIGIPCIRRLMEALYLLPARTPPLPTVASAPAEPPANAAPEDPSDES